MFSTSKKLSESNQAKRIFVIR